MAIARMRQGTHQRPKGTLLGQQRQMLADLDAGSSGGDRLEFAPDRFRGLGLEIEAIQLRQASGEEDIDYRPGFGGPPGLVDSAGTQRLDVVHSQTKQANGAGLNGGAAREDWMLRRLVCRIH